MKVLIADDHKLLADAVGSMLTAQGGFDVVTVETYHQAVAELDQDSGVDIVLLDLKMPGMVGLDSVKSIVEKAKNGKVVLFTGLVDRHFLNSSLELGVKGLIPKTMPLQSLNSVIQLIMSGQIFVPMNDVINNTEQQAGTGADLNEKELFVLRLAADGMTNKEIARDMSCTEVTVKMHMRSICKKLGARNRAHAAMISRELSII